MFWFRSEAFEARKPQELLERVGGVALGQIGEQRAGVDIARQRVAECLGGVDLVTSDAASIADRIEPGGRAVDADHRGCDHAAIKLAHQDATQHKLPPGGHWL